MSVRIICWVSVRIDEGGQGILSAFSRRAVKRRGRDPPPSLFSPFDCSGRIPRLRGLDGEDSAPEIPLSLVCNQETSGAPVCHGHIAAAGQLRRSGGHRQGERGRRLHWFTATRTTRCRSCSGVLKGAGRRASAASPAPRPPRCPAFQIAVRQAEHRAAVLRHGRLKRGVRQLVSPRFAGFERPFCGEYPPKAGNIPNGRNFFQF